MGYGMEMDHGWGIWPLFGMIFWLAIMLIPAWRIVAKAGFPGALSLLLLVPVVNLIMIWVFAFANWPNQRDAGRPG